MRKKVYIALVGGQPLPVYQGVKYAEPDEVVLVCSQQTREEAERICNILKQEVRVVELAPVRISEIRKDCAVLKDEYQDVDIVLNVSGGTKVWTVLFYETFRNLENCKIIYIDQNSYCHDFQTASSVQLEMEKDIHFKLYGTPLSSFVPFGEYTEEDHRVLNIIERIRRNNIKDFNQLTIEAFYTKEDRNKVKTQRQGRIVLKNGSYVEWDKDIPTVILAFQKPETQEGPIVMSSPHVVDLVFNSGWFEYKTARAFAMNPKVKEIRMNCIFKAKNHSDKNEVDLILDMGNKLIFVECKTQIYEKVAIDKFHSVLKNYAGMGTKGIFVTDAPMDEISKEKCANNDIISFSFGWKKGFYARTYDLQNLVNEQVSVINKK